MKRSVNLMSISSILVVAGVFVHSAPIAPTPVTLGFTVVPDPATMGGLSTNDFSTNFPGVEIHSSPDCTVPTNQWPVTAFFLMSQLLSQGPMGTEWTQTVQAVSNPSFYIARTTNYLGGVGPFSLVATWVSGAPPGRLRAVH